MHVLRWNLAPLLILVLADSALVLAANGLMRDSIGARASGRGGTNLGFADNGEMLLDNPGAMVNMSCCELLECGTDFLFTDMQYGDADNAVTDASDNPFPMGQLSWIRKSQDGVLAYGLGVFSQGGFSAEYLLQGPAPFTGLRNYKSMGVLGKVLPGVAARLTPRWSVGGNLGVGISHIELEAPYTLQSGAVAGTPTMLDLQQTGAGLSWSVGTQYQLTSATMLGLTYQEETRMRLGGNSRVEIPGLGQSYFDSELDWVWPRSLGLGLQHQACPCRRYGFDVVWYDWSGAFQQLDLKLSEPTNPLFAAVAGPRIEEAFPLRWRDSVSIRLGVEQALNQSEVVRLGYVYNRNPIPDSTLTNYIPAVLEHTFATGYGWKLAGYEFDFAYQFSYGPTHHVGDSDILGGDFDNSRIRSHAHWLALSVMRRN